MDTEKAKEHIRSHITYPATDAQLKEACNNMSDFSDEDKKEFSEKLPAGSYNSADDVIRALGW